MLWFIFYWKYNFNIETQVDFAKAQTTKFCSNFILTVGVFSIAKLLFCQQPNKASCNSLERSCQCFLKVLLAEGELEASTSLGSRCLTTHFEKLNSYLFVIRSNRGVKISSLSVDGLAPYLLSKSVTVWGVDGGSPPGKHHEESNTLKQLLLYRVLLDIMAAKAFITADYTAFHPASHVVCSLHSRRESEWVVIC